MTALEFIQTEEYASQKRLVYFGRNRRVKNLGEYAHKKAMEWFKNSQQCQN